MPERDESRVRDFYVMPDARLRAALERIAGLCGDDSDPEDNAVQIAREALGEEMRRNA